VSNILFLALVGLTVFCGTGFLFVLPSLRTSRAEKRILQSAQSAPLFEPVQTGSTAVSRLLATLHQLRKHVGVPVAKGLRPQLAAAGLPEEWQADVFLATRLLCPLIGVVTATLIAQNTFFWAVIAAILGYMAPDLWLAGAVRRRRERIRLSLANALDLLVICVEAGLGLDQALQRVGTELVISDAALSQELMQINLEQRAGKPRLDAWRAMSERTRVAEVDSFVSMLAQSDKFGSPIVQALSTFADGLRTKRRQQAEEMAAKTTVKLIFPLVLFIFPSMFIVLLGPAVLSVMRNLGGMFN
jgi:tight adherence protein C